MAISYQQTADKEILDQVRSKHRVSIAELKRLGFSEFCFFEERLQALGFSPLGLTGFLGMLIALFKEVTKIESDLSVSIFNLVLGYQEYPTYACPFGMGVKLYTSFADGTCIISANFESPRIHDDQEKLYKFAAARTVEATWMDHKRWVDKLISEGKQKNEYLSFASYRKLAEQEDQYMLKIKNVTIFGDILSTVASIITVISLLLGFTYLFLFFAGFIEILFPSCLIVSDKTSMLQRFLLASACMAISWTLARFEKNMFTANGVGTKLFGHTPSPGSQGFIATKWLVLFVPLIPVRSYEIAAEYRTRPDKTQYAMKPLKKLDGAQIKETIWQWKLGYFLFILVLIGLSTIPVWKCI